MLKSVALWLENRLHVAQLFQSTAGHKVPPSTNSWFYVFGSGTLLCFVLQIVTGTLLAFVYQPSASQAWASLEYLNNEAFLGWFLRAIHNWGSIFMVAIMSAHLIQTFLFGAYKYPRELTWVSGCFLFLCTLGMAFTGQILRFDQDAYWGLGIGASIMGRVPFIGAQMVHLMLAGSIIAGETLSRFFSLHVFVVPGTIIALLSLHLRLVLTKGINEYPTPGNVVMKETYETQYEEMVKKTGVPFVPNVIGKDLIFSAFLIIAITGCALVFGPAGPSGPPNPTLIHTSPKPDFYFLPVFSALSLLPAYMETFLLLVLPVMLIAILILLPFYSGTSRGDSHSEQTVPQLSQPWRRGRSAGPRVRHGSHPPYRRSTHPAGDSGKREHAGVWQKPESRRGDCAGRLHGNVAAFVSTGGPGFEQALRGANRQNHGPSRHSRNRLVDA